MTTYTLAIGADMLLATVPDGGDIVSEIAKDMDTPPEYILHTGCILTDAEPADDSTIVWESGNEGWIFDETGRDWRFAVKV